MPRSFPSSHPGQDEGRIRRSAELPAPRHHIFSRGLAADLNRAVEKIKRRRGQARGGFSHSIRLPLLICLRRELAGPVTGT